MDPHFKQAAGNKDGSFDSSVTTTSIPSLTSTPSSVSMRQTNQPAASGSFTDSKVVDKKRIQELVKEVDPLEQMDDDVEEVLNTNPPFFPLSKHVIRFHKLPAETAFSPARRRSHDRPFS